MKKVEMYQASDGKTFSTERDCLEHEKGALLEKRLASRLSSEGTPDKWDAEKIAEKLTKDPRNLRAVLDAALLQELYVNAMPEDSEVVMVVAFKFLHGDRSNAENRAMLAERLIACMDGDVVLSDHTILDVVAGGRYEED